MTIERGVIVGNDWSPKQIQAIDLFASGDKNCTEVADAIKVSITTISRWRRNPQFIQSIIEIAKNNLRAELPEIYKVTKTQALTGSHQHIKIILDHLDNLDKLKLDKTDKIIKFEWDL